MTGAEGMKNLGGSGARHKF